MKCLENRNTGASTYLHSLQASDKLVSGGLDGESTAVGVGQVAYSSFHFGISNEMFSSALDWGSSPLGRLKGQTLCAVRSAWQWRHTCIVFRIASQIQSEVFPAFLNLKSFEVQSRCAGLELHTL